jgi:cell division protein ZipA
MDGLRWLLLFFGLLVIVGVYFYSRREKALAEKGETGSSERIEPKLDQEAQALVDAEVEVADEEDLADDDEALASDEPRPQKIVTLRLVGRNKQQFQGDELILSMRGIGLRHGKFGIFHRYDGNDENRTIFAAASLVVPGPVDGVEAFDLMMAAARALAQTLDGELLDESGSTLSIQRERYLREEIIQYQLGV